MGKSAPKPPNPYKVSAAQTQSNIATAKAQQQMAMSGQTGPAGTVNYVADPSSPSGYRAVSTLSPENQALYGQGQNLKALAQGNVGAAMAQPFDLNAARGTNISDIQRTMMDPQWQQQQDALQTQLLNRGIRPGSADYDTEMRQFGQQKDDAYNRMYLDAYTTANNAALQQRNLPFQDYQVLSGAAGLPQGAPQGAVAQPGVAATDLSGNVNNAYNARVQQYNAAMGGLFGLGSAGLGGWAQAGFPGFGAAMALL